MSNENMMDVHKTLDQIQVNVTFSMNGDPLDIIIVCINSKINECFNKLIKVIFRELFSNKLKETDIKIIYNSIIIYSYYDQTIGDKYMKDLFENNIEIHDINVSLLYADAFIYISNDTKKKNRDINIYEFNVYGASFLLFLVGLYILCMGIIEI